MSTILQTVIGVTLLVGVYATNPIFGQKPICEVKGDRIVCTIEENTTDIIGPVEVPNMSRLVIKVIKKSPFDDCVRGEIKVTEIKESDPIEAMLKILAKASGFSVPSGAAALTVGEEAALTVGEEKASTPEHRALLAELEVWKEALKVINEGVMGKIKRADSLSRDLESLFASPPRTLASYNAIVPPIQLRLDTAIDEAEPSMAAELLRYPSVLERYKGLVKPGVSNTDRVLIAAGKVLNDVDGYISSLKINTDALVAARTEMRSVRGYLDQIKYSVQKGNAFEQEFSFFRYSQRGSETSITCTNTFTKKETLAKLPVTILYRNDPALSVSVGILLSTTAKQKVGITSQRTGVDADGTPTFKNVFGIVDHAGAQIAPFSFLNYRLFYFGKGADPLAKPKYSLNLSGGVGVNPNSGSNEVEYFFGPAFGIKNYLIQFGDHIGRFQKGLNGGFLLGDTVPGTFPSTLPINKIYKHGFGVAISYRLPL